MYGGDMVLGGCCGMGPAFIYEIARVIREGG